MSWLLAKSCLYLNTAKKRRLHSAYPTNDFEGDQLSLSCCLWDWPCHSGKTWQVAIGKKINKISLVVEKSFSLQIFIRGRNLFENIGKYFLFSGAHINLWQSRRKTGRSTSSSVPTHCFRSPEIIGFLFSVFIYSPTFYLSDFLYFVLAFFSFWCRKLLVNIEANHCLYTNGFLFTTQLPIAGASSCFYPWLG